MSTINDPRPLTRKELSEFLPNMRAVRAFEKLFDLIPPEFIDQQAQLDALSIVAELANSTANEATAAVERLAAAVEQLAAAPTTEQEEEADTLAPRPDLEALEGQLTDNTTELLRSSETLTNGAAAAVGTLNNAPVAGDPTKWVAIDDNGTTRYIPTW